MSEALLRALRRALPTLEARQEEPLKVSPWSWGLALKHHVYYGNLSAQMSKAKWFLLSEDSVLTMCSTWMLQPTLQ